MCYVKACMFCNCLYLEAITIAIIAILSIPITVYTGLYCYLTSQVLQCPPQLGYYLGAIALLLHIEYSYQHTTFNE